MTAGSEDAKWERQRTLDQEAERQLQKRIKDRVPQRRARGKAKAGDIDGMRIALVVICDAVFTILCVLAVLDQIQDEWEACTSPDVRTITTLPQNTEAIKSSAL